eukprot:7172372-Prymnesium_polylepis.3
MRSCITAAVAASLLERRRRSSRTWYATAGSGSCAACRYCERCMRSAASSLSSDCALAAPNSLSRFGPSVCGRAGRACP